MKFIPTKSPSKFLAKEDLPNGKALVTIKGFSTGNAAPDNKQPEIRDLIHFSEFQKPMIFNSTNRKLMCMALSLNPVDWDTDNAVGKKVVLWNNPEVQNLQGDIVGGIRIRAYNPRPATATPTATPPAPIASHPQQPPNFEPGFDDDIPF